MSYWTSSDMETYFNAVKKQVSYYIFCVTSERLDWDLAMGDHLSELRLSIMIGIIPHELLDIP